MRQLSVICLSNKFYKYYYWFFILLVIFPQDLIEHGFNAEKYALLGLGDIVIPGIFIALLLRYDIR